jgi:hypothetical protein
MRVYFASSLTVAAGAVPVTTIPNFYVCPIYITSLPVNRPSMKTHSLLLVDYILCVPIYVDSCEQDICVCTVSPDAIWHDEFSKMQQGRMEQTQQNDYITMFTQKYCSCKQKRGIVKFYSMKNCK